MVESDSSVVNIDCVAIEFSKIDNIPVQVTTIRLTKDKYMCWLAAITIEIAGLGRIAYINGRKVEPHEKNPAWDTWFLENNQVETWIVNSVSSDIQPPILRKKTSRDMWVNLEQMYGQKKNNVHVYQLMKDIYALRQGDRSVAVFYAALKSKWEELDYYTDDVWSCPQDQTLYWTKDRKNRMLAFLGGLNDVFKGIRSQILNSGDMFSIEDVYAHLSMKLFIISKIPRGVGEFSEEGEPASVGENISFESEEGIEPNEDEDEARIGAQLTPTCSIASAAQLRLLSRRPKSPLLSIYQRLASSIAQRSLSPPFCALLLLPEASLAVCRRLVCAGCHCSLPTREARGDLSPDFAAPFCVTPQHCLHRPTLCCRHRPELICLLPASPPSIVPSAVPGCRLLREESQAVDERGSTGTEEERSDERVLLGLRRNIVTVLGKFTLGEESVQMR
ncbi:hypothetical protein EJ110_NYTH50386 [Nymphaea thermarum]|nr:hypothetical protein EJ110_NYTH50386 [Nymphaea thermarum]